MKTSPDVSTVFHPADVLYALEWASLAPGLVHWRLLLDSETETRLVSVIPPGAHRPAFQISRDGEKVRLAAVALAETGEPVRYFPSLRTAVKAICPLSDDHAVAANEAMEELYPRRPDRA